MVSALVCVLPLSQMQKQTNYNPISSLKNKGIDVYSYGYVAPEMIWQYGDKIPQIKPNNSTINFPSDASFGILSKQLTDEELEFLNKSFEVEHQDTFDLNKKASGEKGHKNRLISYYYKLTRK